MNHQPENFEQLSALADGQLPKDEEELTLDWLAQDEEAQSSWNTYHLLGEVMRSGVASCPERDAAFMQRMNVALAKESIQPLQIDAIKKEATQAIPQGFEVKNNINQPAANDAFVHWRWVGGLATLLAFVLVSWQGLSGGFDQGAAPQIAQVIVPTRQSVAALPLVVAGAETPVMIRDPQLDAFLAAHKQFGGTSAFQKPSGFLSNAVFEGAPR
jgi:sigma-E factor negative regulatory protein RseA